MTTINTDTENELKDLRAFIQDAHAYLRHSFREGTKPEIILTTLTHDIAGLANHDRCFCPRVSGYCRKEDAK
jgi:hypothetical protein